jgi:hypothetical protein
MLRTGVAIPLLTVCAFTALMGDNFTFEFANKQGEKVQCQLRRRVPRQLVSPSGRHISDYFTVVVARFQITPSFLTVRRHGELVWIRTLDLRSRSLYFQFCYILDKYITLVRPVSDWLLFNSWSSWTGIIFVLTNICILQSLKLYEKWCYLKCDKSGLTPFCFSGLELQIRIVGSRWDMHVCCAWTEPGG